jgi:hypothetical protein
MAVILALWRMQLKASGFVIDETLSRRKDSWMG